MKWMPAPPLLAALVVSPVLLASAACGGPKRLPLYPVTGQVSFKGKPTPGALVVFQHLQHNAVQPSGYVREDGSFQLTTYAKDDGAPEGEYTVMITWTERDARPDPKTGEVPNRLPARYASPRTSGLRVKVEKGTNNQPRLQLSP
jgi:hypothetical protein